MNSLKGEITSIKVSGQLALVQVQIKTVFINSIILEVPNSTSYLKIGNTIRVIFKETEVVIGKGLEHQISLQNKINGQIQQIEMGKLLSKLIVDTEIGPISAIITSNAVEQLNLHVGEKVVAMIKTNEIMLSE